MSFFRRRKKVEDDDIIEGEVEDIHDEDETEGEDGESDFSADVDNLPEDQGKKREEDLEEVVSPYAPPPGYRERSQPPLERVAPDIPTPDEAVITPYIRRDSEPKAQEPGKSGKKTPRRLRFSFPRIRLSRLIAWGEVNPGLLLLSLGLIAGGIFWTLHNRGQSSEDLEAWWPLALLGFALLWALSALIARRAASFLAASALAGLSISLLLDAQDLLTWRETLVGTVLIAVGIGIIARGLVLRQGSVAR